MSSIISIKLGLLSFQPLRLLILPPRSRQLLRHPHRLFALFAKHPAAFAAAGAVFAVGGVLGGEGGGELL